MTALDRWREIWRAFRQQPKGEAMSDQPTTPDEGTDPSNPEPVPPVEPVPDTDPSERDPERVGGDEGGDVSPSPSEHAPDDTEGTSGR